MNQIDLKGKKAVITGASGDIGRAIARRFIESGAQVSSWDREPPSGCGDEHACIVDVCSETMVRQACIATLDALGSIDILVNNAGRSGPFAPVVDYPLDAWNDVLAINLTGPYLCCKAVLPGMLERGYGRIVNVSSVSGKEGSAHLCAYSAAKAGLIGFTKALAREVAGTGVLANCVTPGPTRSAMTRNTPPEQLRAMVGRVPLKRMMEPEEVAAMVAWLSSGDCSFTTGSIGDLSGGRTSY